jgi:hypothetical protein
MEMVSKQTISERFGNRIDVFAVQIKEVFVIAFLDEYVFPVIAPVVNMVVGVIEER